MLKLGRFPPPDSVPGPNDPVMLRRVPLGRPGRSRQGGEPTTTGQMG
jgi:hypothetical protein